MVLSVGADIAEHKLVAIGRGFSDPRHARDAADAGHVLKQDRLAESCREPSSEEARHEVGRAPRCIRDDHGERPVRPALSCNRGGHRDYHRDQQSQRGNEAEQ